MRVLQVWNDSILPDEFRVCMKSVHDICRESCLEYTVVCMRGDLFSDFNSAKIVNYKAFIEGKNTDWWQNILQYHESRADFVRLEYAKATPDLFYVDADVELLGIPEFLDNGSPYFGTRGNCIDFFMLYVNGNTQFFVDLMHTMTKMYPPVHWLIFMRHFAIHYRKGLPKFKEVNIIPESCYKRNNFKKRN